MTTLPIGWQDVRWMKDYGEDNRAWVDWYAAGEGYPAYFLWSVFKIGGADEEGEAATLAEAVEAAERAAKAAGWL